jgi:hypothetical protein
MYFTFSKELRNKLLLGISEYLFTLELPVDHTCFQSQIKARICFECLADILEKGLAIEQFDVKKVR